MKMLRTGRPGANPQRHVQDHYENLYIVVAGTKTFFLKPPSSVHQMHLTTYDTFQEVMDSRDLSFTCVPAQGAGKVQWCPIGLRDDPEFKATVGSEDGLCEGAPAGPRERFFHAPACLKVTVRAGDMLYLPAMWYHYVMQDEGSADAVIAVNYWWDMRFGERFATFNLLQALSDQVGLTGSVTNLAGSVGASYCPRWLGGSEAMCEDLQHTCLHANPCARSRLIQLCVYTCLARCAQHRRCSHRRAANAAPATLLLGQNLAQAAAAAEAS
jgi:Cupin-like domain